MKIEEGLEKFRDVFLKAFWHAHKYKPSCGEFPIYDVNGELVHTSYGQEEVHQDTSRIKLLSGGVRAGKSMVLAMEAARHLVIVDGLMWIIGPDYELARPEFDYLLQGVHALGYVKGNPSTPGRGSCSFETAWDFTVTTKSADDLEKIAGKAPDVLVLPEINQSPAGILDKAYERGLEKRAPILGGGTLERSSVWFQKALERFQGPNEVNARSFYLPSWTNPKNFPAGRQDPEIVELERLLGPELFLERCAAIPAKPEGLVHRAFSIRKHVKKLDFDPSLPIELAIDPATHTYAVEVIQWFTIPGQFTKDLRTGLMNPLTEVRVIDEIYRHNIIAQDIIPIVMAKPYFKYIKGGVIDTAGKQRQGNKSQVQIWFEMAGLQLRSNYVRLSDGIDVMNLRLRDYPGYGKPLIYFAHHLTNDVLPSGKAMGIVAEMGLYKYPEWKEGSSDKRDPTNANNDGIKAVSYWLFDRFGPVIERKPRPKPRVRAYH